MTHDKIFHVYIMTSKRYGTLYTGVTSNIGQRIYQHKQQQAEGFTKKYGVDVIFFDQDQ